jgi:ferredoxin-type protein NapH
LLRLRRPAQAGTVLFFLLLPWLNATGRTKIYGSLFALDIYGLPLADPLSAAQNLLLEGPAAPSLCAGAGIVLAAAFLLGKFFCGWICPYGLLSELAHKLRPRREKARRPPPSAPRLRHVRAAVVALGLVVSALWGLPFLQRLSMPGELSLAPLHAPEGAGALLAALSIPAGALLLEALSGKRLWCRFICPQAFLLGLAARCNRAGFGVRRTASRCVCSGNERPCSRACSLRLEPCRAGGPPRGECAQCGDCVLVCAEYGGALAPGMRDGDRRAGSDTGSDAGSGRDA